MVFYYQNLKLELSEDVYAPAEDSFLLAENIDAKKDDSVLDVGTGAGILALTAAGKASRVLGVDVNPKAVELARKNAVLNGISNVEFIESDLFENVHESFDLIIFNPPYIPVDEEGLLEKSWSGGKNGLEVVERFLDKAASHLKKGGRILLLVSSLNGLENVEQMIEKKHFSSRIIAEKKIPFEMLHLLYIQTKQERR